jgi:hypothetical protein
LDQPLLSPGDVLKGSSWSQVLNFMKQLV